jgi:hypothetical protein
MRSSIPCVAARRELVVGADSDRPLRLRVALQHVERGPQCHDVGRLYRDRARVTKHPLRARRCRERRPLVRRVPTRRTRHRLLARFRDRDRANRPARAVRRLPSAACAFRLRCARAARKAARLWRRASPWRCSQRTARALYRTRCPRCIDWTNAVNAIAAPNSTDGFGREESRNPGRLRSSHDCTSAVRCGQAVAGGDNAGRGRSSHDDGSGVTRRGMFRSF